MYPGASSPTGSGQVMPSLNHTKSKSTSVCFDYSHLQPKKNKKQMHSKHPDIASHISGWYLRSFSSHGMLQHFASCVVETCRNMFLNEYVLKCWDKFSKLLFWKHEKNSVRKSFDLENENCSSQRFSKSSLPSAGARWPVGQMATGGWLILEAAGIRRVFRSMVMADCSDSSTSTDSQW